MNNTDTNSAAALYRAWDTLAAEYDAACDCGDGAAQTDLETRSVAAYSEFVAACRREGVAPDAFAPRLAEPAPDAFAKFFAPVD